MNDETDRSDLSPTFQFSRIINVPGVTALALSTFIGIGFFLSPGLIAQYSLINNPFIPVISFLLFLPLILISYQTAIRHSGQEQPNENNGRSITGWVTFISGWVILGGYFCLGVILVWGTAVQLQQLLENIYGITLSVNRVILAVTGYVIIINLFGLKLRWRSSTYLLMLSILLIFGVLAWIFTSIPATGQVRGPYRSYGIMPAISLWLVPSLWGAGFIFDHRFEIQNPTQSIKRGMLIALAIFCGLGFLGGMAVLSRAGYLEYGKAPLYAILSGQSESASVLYLLAGITCCLIAFERCFVSFSNHLVDMTQFGTFLSSPVYGPYLKYIPLWHYLFTATFLVLTAVYVPMRFVFSGASIFFLLQTGLYSLEGIFKKSIKGGDSKSTKLPSGTIVPGLALFTTIYLLSTLPLNSYQIGIGWIIIGAGFYALFGRKKWRQSRRTEKILPELVKEERHRKYHVIVAASNPAAAPNLIRTGYNMAMANEGDVSVLQVVVLPEHAPPEIKKEKAVNAWNALNGMISASGFDPQVVKPIVRLAPAAAMGVLETVQEEEADFLVLGFAEKNVLTDKYIEPVLEQIISSASCGVLVVKGLFCSDLERIVVVTRDNPHDDAVVETGKSLVQVLGGKLQLVHLFGKDSPKDRESRIKEHLEDIFKGSEEILEQAEQEFITTDSVRQTILDQTSSCDLLIIGASTEGIFERAYFGGVPIEVATKRSAATILVKKDEAASQFWLRRLWEVVYSLMPKLSKNERAEIYKVMRQSARAKIDFYILIILSSTIAVLGLIQNSGAVIIGAMLVAPLMSPILALGNSIVQGNLYLFLQAAESILKGVLLAIGVAFMLSLFIPEQPLTQEILSRTQPNLLDMIVALASGAAAAYAISREELAAALPGVAISAALVPPLCVVGFGLAEAQFMVAGGALLLFITNLGAIVLAATIIFLFLGFKPLHVEFGTQARRGILITVLILVLIAVPLAYTSYTSQVRFQRINLITRILEELAASYDFQVEDVQVIPKGDDLEVSATFYMPGDMDDLLLNNIQDNLSENLKKPISLNFRVVRSEFIESSP